MKHATHKLLLVIALYLTVSLHAAEKPFTFNVTNKPLADLILEIASINNYNIIMPAGDDLTKTTVTYKNPEKLSYQGAWDRLVQILLFASYSPRFLDDDTVTFLKTDKKELLTRQIWPLYIDPQIDQIPNTDEIIRAIFFLANISVKEQKDMLQSILTGAGSNAFGMLTQNADLQFDEKTNGLIITDKAEHIKSAMSLIMELDRGGIRNAIEVVPLYYTSAKYIVEVLKELVPDTKGSAGGQKSPTQTPYFPQNTRVTELETKNAVVIMGTPHGIDVVKDFIIKYLDVPPDTGESILHIYELQYLLAETFAPVLKALVSPEVVKQAAGEKKIVIEGQRYFDEIIILAEKINPPKALEAVDATYASSTINESSPQVGGNRLIVAARNQDWVRIKKLIDDLDKPQPQIAIEVLIVDIDVKKTKKLGHQMRNKAGLNDSIGNNVNFQTAMLDNAALTPPDVGPSDGTAAGASALRGNLIQVVNDIAGANDAGGSLVVTLGNPDPLQGGLYSVWQVLNTVASTKILSQPFLITTNNKPATVAAVTARYVPGDVKTEAVSNVVNNRYLEAQLSVTISPRISLTNNINMLIGVKIQDFLSDAQVANNMATRTFQTNANMGNGEILVLGGLTRDREVIAQNETPFLAQIPLIGWFFKAKSKAKDKDNLLVFIHPVIIQPHMEGMSEFTQNKINVAKENLDETYHYEEQKDPINRWFFKANKEFQPKSVDRYVENLHATHKTSVIKKKIKKPIVQEPVDVMCGTPVTDESTNTEQSTEKVCPAPIRQDNVVAQGPKKKFFDDSDRDEQLKQLLAHS